MPILTGDLDRFPGWCELENYAIGEIADQQSINWWARHAVNKLVVAAGSCTVAVSPDQTRTLGSGEMLEVVSGAYRIVGRGQTTIVQLGGHWGEDCGGIGLFRVEPTLSPGDCGDPVTYPKNTSFDRHYHDSDEYWIVLSGAGTVCTENVLYRVGPGDCVVTRMGDSHDFPWVDEPAVGIYFETTLYGRKRRGHLWEHTHGRPERPDSQVP